MKRLAESRCQDVTFSIVIPAGLKNKQDETGFWASDIQSILNLQVQDVLQAVCVCLKKRVTTHMRRTPIQYHWVWEGTLTGPDENRV